MIKIERKETPHTQEAMDDLQEACNTGRSYNTEHVNQALREVFHGKCYICENSSDRSSTNGFITSSMLASTVSS